MVEGWRLVVCPAFVTCITDDNPSSTTLGNISVLVKKVKTGYSLVEPVGKKTKLSPDIPITDL